MHKKITIILPTDVEFDITGVASKAVFLSIETIMDSEPAPAPKKRSRKNGSRDACIMSHFSPEGTFNNETIKKWFKKDGFAPTGLTAVTRRLRAHGFILAIADGFKFVQPFSKVDAVQS